MKSYMFKFSLRKAMKKKEELKLTEKHRTSLRYDKKIAKERFKNDHCSYSKMWKKSCQFVCALILLHFTNSEANISNENKHRGQFYFLLIVFFLFLFTFRRKRERKREREKKR